LGATEFGVYALGLAAFNLVSTLAVAGLDSAALKFLPAAMATTNSMHVRSTIRVLLTLSLLFGSSFGVLLYLVTPYISEFIFHVPASGRVLSIFAIGIPAFAISCVLIASLQAFHDIVWRATIKYICEPLLRIALAVLLLWMGCAALGAAASFVIATITTALLALFPIRNHLGLSYVQDGVQLPAGTVLRFSLPLLSSLVFASVATRSDILLLGYWTEPEQVGIYSAAFQTASILILTLGAMESIATPLFSHSVARDDYVELARLYKTVLRWSLSVALPLFLVMTLFAKEVISVFGSDFESGALSLSILAFGQIINAATASTHNVLVLTGHSRMVMWNSIGVGILQIGVHMLLIPRFGMLGAAVGTTSAIVAINGVRLLQSHRILGLQPFERMIWKPLLAGFCCTFVALALWPWKLLLGTPLLIALVALVYISLLFALGLDEDDQIILLRARESVRVYFGLAFK
jgi:O-antigen/teichoic acid export membrane protein